MNNTPSLPDLVESYRAEARRYDEERQRQAAPGSVGAAQWVLKVGPGQYLFRTDWDTYGVTLLLKADFFGQAAAQAIERAPCPLAGAQSAAVQALNYLDALVIEAAHMRDLAEKLSR